MPLRASLLGFSSKMPTHLVELGVQINTPDVANKKPQLKAKGFGAFGRVGRTRRD